jgi:hypothetical protein
MVEKLEPVWFAKAMKKAMESCPIFFDGCKTSLLQAAPRHAHET